MEFDQIKVVKRLIEKLVGYCRSLLAGRDRAVLLVFLGAMVLMGGGLLGFVSLAEEVLEGDTHVVDERILLAFRESGDANDPLGPHWVEEMGRDVTALGGMTVLVMLTLGVFVYLLMIRRVRTAFFLLAATGSGMVASSVLKLWIARPRPDLVPHGSYVYTASFPSGHSMLSAVCYLTMAAMLCSVRTSLRERIFLLGSAGFLVVLIGVSRVYLGVHWPTDVLAGWMMGGAWAAGAWLIAVWARKV